MKVRDLIHNPRNNIVTSTSICARSPNTRSGPVLKMTAGSTILLQCYEWDGRICRLASFIMRPSMQLSTGPRTNCGQSSLQVACSEMTPGRGSKSESWTRGSLAAPGRPPRDDIAGRGRDRTGASCGCQVRRHETPPQSNPLSTPPPCVLRNQ